MTDPHTPDEGAPPPTADRTPVDPSAEDSPQVDSFAAEPPADPEPTPEQPAPEQPVAAEPEAPEPPLLGGTPDPLPDAVEPIPGEPAEPVDPVAPAEFAGPADPAPAESAPAEPTPEDVPAERTLADEDPAAPEPDSSDPVVLPSPPGAPEDTADATVADEPGATAHRRAWLPLAAVGTVVALLVAGTGYVAWQLRQEARAEQAREEATAAARDAARLLFSYDHETLDADFEKGLSVTTGEFREQYSRTTEEVVTPVAEQYDAVVVAEVIEAAVVEASADRATALVFLNQGTTSTRVQGQQVDQSRVRMSLVREDGRWLVEGVRAL